MPVLNDADAVKVGTTDVAKVMVGATQVWPSGTTPPANYVERRYIKGDWVNLGECNVGNVDRVQFNPTQDADGLVAVDLRDHLGFNIEMIGPSDSYTIDGAVWYRGNDGMIRGDSAARAWLLGQTNGASITFRYYLPETPAYVAKAIDLGATFVQVGGLDYVSGLPLVGGSDPGVSVDGIDAWQGEWSFNMGSQLTPPGGTWSFACIFRHLPGLADAERVDIGARDSQDLSTKFWTIRGAGDVNLNVTMRVYNAGPATDAFVPYQTEQDWAFAVFTMVDDGAGTVHGYATILDSTNTLVQSSRQRNTADAGVLDEVYVATNPYIQVAGVAVFPHVYLTQQQIADLLATVPHVGQGNS